MIRTALAALAVALMSAPAQAQVEQSEKHTFEIVSLTDQLDSPWGMAFLPGNEGILITQKDGDVRLFKDGKLLPDAIPGGPKTRGFGQGGLLDIAVHPKFEDNRWVYFTYADIEDGDAATALARATFNGTRFEGLERLFVMTPRSSGGRHFGSRLAFDEAGFLFMSSGDRGDRWESQELGNHIGGVYRLHDDGRVPADNPFVNTAGAKPEIYSYGHRNAQGMARNPASGAIWLHEHGPRGGDEINIVKRGANYGWPKVTFGREYWGGKIADETSLPGLEDPVMDWTPSIAPSGMAFYTGDKFPNWAGNLFVGALKFEHLERLTLEGDKVASREILMEDFEERIRDVRNGPDGFLYVLTDGSDGQLLRLEPR